jgi:TRAP-type C4-dicarboxylate transport system substrate-binding protein
MLRRQLLAASPGLAVTGLLGRDALAQSAARWDMALVWPPGNFHVASAEIFARRVAEVTGNAVRITVHPSGSLGLRGPETMAAIRDGIVPIADFVIQQQAGDAPITGFAALPGLASGYRQTRILADIAKPVFEATLARFGQKLLYMIAWPGQGVYTREPVGAAADLRGLRIRTSDRNSTDYFAALGASPIQLPWGEVVPALSSGLIAGVTTSSSSGVDGKFWEFVRHFNKTDWANPLNAVTVNLAAFNRLRPEHRSAIEAAAIELEPEFWQVSEKQDTDNTAALARNGMTVTEPSPAFRAELSAAAAPIWDAWVRAAGPDARRIIDTFRARAG